MDMVDITGLKEFSRMADRDEAPFLVGRADEVDLVGYLHANALKKTRSGRKASSMTALLQGAPGAGKTSLLHHLRERWRTEGDRAPHVAKVDTRTLEDEAKLATAVIETLHPGASIVWRTVHSAERSGQAGLPGTGVKLADGTLIHPGEPSLDSILPVLRVGGLKDPDWVWDRAIVLMADEIQALKPAAAPVIMRLHQGEHGLPLVPLFAGLGDSLSIVEGFTGTSRLTADNIQRLGALNAEQAKGAVLTMFRTYGVRGSDANRDHWADWAVAVSDAWPQHLHNAMRAIARGLLETQGRLDIIDTGKVREQERKLRLDVYGRRQSSPMTKAFDLVAAVLRDCPASLTDHARRPNQADVLASILRHRRTGGTPEDVSWSLPTNPDSGVPMDADAFLRHLIHRGALQERSNKRMECPIPTFRDFLIEYGNPAPALENRIDPMLPEKSVTNTEPVLDRDADPPP